MFPRKCSTKAHGEFKDFGNTNIHFCIPVFIAHLFFQYVHMEIAIAEVTITHRVEPKCSSDFFNAHDEFRKICTRYYYVFCFVEGVGLYSG